MSNTPTHPGTDTPEPILPDGGDDDDAVGRPLPDDGQSDDLPAPDSPGTPGPDVVSPNPDGPF